MYKTTVQLIMRSQYWLEVLISLPITRIYHIPSLQWQIKLPPIIMFIQDSHGDSSPALCDKHNFRLYAHLSVTFSSPLCQTQLPPVCSPRCHMLIPSSLWQAQLLSACSSKCHVLIPSSLWQTQLPPVCSHKCRMLTYQQPPIGDNRLKGPRSSRGLTNYSYYYFSDFKF